LSSPDELLYNCEPNSWANSQKYIVKVPFGVISAQNIPLENEFSFEFYNPKMKIVEIFPKFR